MAGSFRSAAVLALVTFCDSKVFGVCAGGSSVGAVTSFFSLCILISVEHDWQKQLRLTAEAALLGAPHSS